MGFQVFRSPEWALRYWALGSEYESCCGYLGEEQSSPLRLEERETEILQGSVVCDFSWSLPGVSVPLQRQEDGGMTFINAITPSTPASPHHDAPSLAPSDYLMLVSVIE